jgi:hypothetical protein
MTCIASGLISTALGRTHSDDVGERRGKGTPDAGPIDAGVAFGKRVSVEAGVDEGAFILVDVPTLIRARGETEEDGGGEDKGRESLWKTVSNGFAPCL